jgi:hypothetical protein
MTDRVKENWELHAEKSDCKDGHVIVVASYTSAAGGAPEIVVQSGSGKNGHVHVIDVVPEQNWTPAGLMLSLMGMGPGCRCTLGGTVPHRHATGTRETILAEVRAWHPGDPERCKAVERLVMGALCRPGSVAPAPEGAPELKTLSPGDVVGALNLPGKL